MTVEKVVEIENVSMNYHTLDGETLAIKDLSFNVYKGEIVIIVGPSGCGKSTALSIISGLIKPSTGKVVVNGKAVSEPNKSIGYMFQKDHLFEWRTILNNVLIGLEIQNKLNSQTKAKAEQLLEIYGLGEFKHYYPSQLSGGMRQRVALIRTLAVEPDLLLLDEPFTALDYQTKLAVTKQIMFACSISLNLVIVCYMDAMKKEALKTIVQIAYEIALGKRGVTNTKEEDKEQQQKRQKDA